ncbi:hypothetical protein GGR58DRAFT_477441 [Xylaria digitata]|nr:hypothetical protein GGR58DRAFT_477441 [Xylaria digitata]
MIGYVSVPLYLTVFSRGTLALISCVMYCACYVSIDKRVASSRTKRRINPNTNIDKQPEPYFLYLTNIMFMIIYRV